MFYSFLKTLILPPSCFFLLFLAGWLVRSWRPRLGRGLLWTLLALIYLATTPFAAAELMASLQRYGPLDLERADPEIGAIVVLGAGVYYSAPEYWELGAPAFGTDVADTLSLQRLAYAAYLARATGKPILISGGTTGANPDRTVARAMSTTLSYQFGMAARWLEQRSTTTMSNAEYSAQILHAENIKKVYLVTHAWHMPRAMIAFEKAGIDAVPAPTAFVSRSEGQWQDFMPSAEALSNTYYAVYEWLGITWYRVSTII